MMKDSYPHVAVLHQEKGVVVEVVNDELWDEFASPFVNTSFFESWLKL